jgi:transaldolase / glucose-6-phosphate isomerase
MATLQVNERLVAITAAGTSVWLDEIRRGLIASGELRRVIEEGSLRGVTSNPTIFNRAILGSEDYDEQFAELARYGVLTRGIYEELVIADIQAACDALRDVYDATGRYDGYVSLEVDPDLAFETRRTMEQAREYSERVDRPNLMIKIPGTAEGLPAIEEMIHEGRNINVTLLFAVSAYDQVAEAYIRGLERRHAEGQGVDVRSVASFFVSRVDTEVDRRLEALGRTDLCGRAGLANARAAYFESIFHSERFADLRAAGAPVQRPLWASTGIKNPAYPDTMYFEGLVGPGTVDTMAMATLLAAGDHARVDPEHLTVAIDPDPDLRALAHGGIDLDDVTAQLLSEGVDKFVEPFEQLLDAIEQRREAVAMRRPPAIRRSILDPLESRIALRVQRAGEEDVARRIWRKDATLWGDPGRPELADRLGWLTVPEQMRECIDDLEAFADRVRDEDTTDVVLLGMGGSSLAPEVIRRSFAGHPPVPSAEPVGRIEGRPRLHMLDSTDAAAIRAVEAAIDSDRTLFVVSTKSGGTIETLSLFRHFHGRRPHGDAFAAITDPGSGLEKLAHELRFQRTFLNDPEIGGRYSALSYYGLAPSSSIRPLRASACGSSSSSPSPPASRARASCRSSTSRPATLANTGPTGRSSASAVGPPTPWDGRGTR